jgi:hypothetical protein
MINDPILVVALSGSLLGCLVSVFAGIRFFAQERERARRLMTSSRKAQVVSILGTISNKRFGVIEKKLVKVGNTDVVRNRLSEITFLDVNHLPIGIKSYATGFGTNRISKEHTDFSRLNLRRGVSEALCLQ